MTIQETTIEHTLFILKALLVVVLSSIGIALVFGFFYLSISFSPNAQLIYAKIFEYNYLISNIYYIRFNCLCCFFTEQIKRRNWLSESDVRNNCIPTNCINYVHFNKRKLQLTY